MLDYNPTKPGDYFKIFPNSVRCSQNLCVSHVLLRKNGIYFFADRFFNIHELRLLRGTCCVIKYYAG